MTVPWWIAVDSDREQRQEQEQEQRKGGTMTIPYQIVHASDAEVGDEIVAGVVDRVLGVGSRADGNTSLYLALFAGTYLGRPRRDEDPPSTGYPTGDPRVTATARRRAARVLKHIHRAEFEAIMAYEVHYLLAHPDEAKKG